MEERIDGAIVQENLDRAVASGAATVDEDGRYGIPVPIRKSSYLQVKFVLPLECRFLNDFVFSHAYAGAAVPSGCRACFKVKAAPSTLRGLVALRDLLEQAPYHSKCGVDFFNPYSRDLYAGYLYFDGLEAARAGWKEMRDKIDAHPSLGPETGLAIKRGCSNYEAACGPSDQWVFADDLEALEAGLRDRVQVDPLARHDYRLARSVKMVEWIRFAYAARDDSYLDFTGGRPLHPSMVTYSPDAP